MKSTQLESEVVSINTFKMSHDMAEASDIIGQINRVLQEAYKLDMKPLRTNEMSFVEFLYYDGAAPVKNRIEGTLRSSKQIASLPETLQIESIRLHMAKSGIEPLFIAANNCKQSRFQRMPIPWSLCEINTEGLVQLGPIEAIKALYATIITSPEQREFYELSTATAKNITRLYELSQDSTKVGFQYNDIDEFFNRLENLFYCKGEEVKFSADWLKNI
jgi:hypothetical protein